MRRVVLAGDVLLAGLATPGPPQPEPRAAAGQAHPVGAAHPRPPAGLAGLHRQVPRAAALGAGAAVVLARPGAARAERRLRPVVDLADRAPRVRGPAAVLPAQHDRDVVVPPLGLGLARRRLEHVEANPVSPAVVAARLALAEVNRQRADDLRLVAHSDFPG